jgi:Tn3 transposase DDE domain
MQSLSSCLDATRMRRRVDRLSLEKKLSTMFSHEPCLGCLVIAAIVYWNSTYIADAVAHLQGKEDPDDALLAHTTPLTWEHIDYTARFTRCPAPPPGAHALDTPYRGDRLTRLNLQIFEEWTSSNAWRALLPVNGSTLASCLSSSPPISRLTYRSASAVRGRCRARQRGRLRRSALRNALSTPLPMSPPP